MLDRDVIIAGVESMESFRLTFDVSTDSLTLCDDAGILGCTDKITDAVGIARLNIDCDANGVDLIVPKTFEVALGVEINSKFDVALRCNDSDNDSANMLVVCT